MTDIDSGKAMKVLRLLYSHYDAVWKQNDSVVLVRHVQADAE